MLQAKPVYCPVCNATTPRLLWSTTAEAAARHFIVAENNVTTYQQLVLHLRLLWAGDTCDVMKCISCGFCFSYPYIAGDAEFYSLAFDRTGYPSWKWEYQKTYNVLCRQNNKDIKLLEVGAGNGAFLKKIIPEIIPAANIVATEYSEYGRNEIEKMHVKCHASDVRDLLGQAFEGHFDVVCIFQVLEHMDNIDKLFEKLSFAMKKGGSLFIAVPNAERIDFNENNGALLEMPPNHIGRWNKKCFEIKGQQFGFAVEDYDIEAAGYLSIYRKFVTYRFLRSAQMAGTIENGIVKIKNRKMGKVLRLAGVLWNVLKAMPLLPYIRKTMGDSQWVHMTKV